MFRKKFHRVCTRRISSVFYIIPTVGYSHFDTSFDKVAHCKWTQGCTNNSQITNHCQHYPIFRNKGYEQFICMQNARMSHRKRMNMDFFYAITTICNLFSVNMRQYNQISWTFWTFFEQITGWNMFEWLTQMLCLNMHAHCLLGEIASEKRRELHEIIRAYIFDCEQCSAIVKNNRSNPITYICDVCSAAVVQNLNQAKTITVAMFNVHE